MHVSVERRLQEIENRKAEIRTLLESGEEVDLDALEDELKDLKDEEEELRRRRDLASRIATGTASGIRVLERAEARPTVEVRTPDDPHDTMEYRRAFMDYVTRGVRSDVLEFRDDETTLPTDIGAVIPTTILNRIVEKMEEYGRIWSRVTKPSIQGGVEIPVSSVKPKAVWLAAGEMADKQKKTVSAKISFGYHKLQARVAIELVAGTVALPIFEQTVGDNVAEAMVVALEEGIIAGSRSEEHTSELQSRENLVCRLLLEQKKILY